MAKKRTKSNNAAEQYAVKILIKIDELFNGEESLIDRKEFQNADNVTAFVHALCNIVPTHVYNKITGDEKNTLEVNHLANMLVMQNAAFTE